MVQANPSRPFLGVNLLRLEGYSQTGHWMTSVPLAFEHPFPLTIGSKADGYANILSLSFEAIFTG